MPTTPVLGLPYPLAGASDNVPYDMQLLAERIELMLKTAAEDTGWVTLQTGTASVPTIQYRRVGNTVTVTAYGTLTAGLANAANTTLGSNIVPAGARPVAVADGAARLNGGAGTAFLIVDTSGNLLMRNQTGSAQTVISSSQVTYLRA